MNVSFTVIGHPQPQGSAKAFIPRGWKRAIITSDNKSLKPWRQEIAGQAMVAMQGQQLEEGPVSLTLNFFFAKPKSASKKITQKITKPDIDKLARGVLDALTGIVFRDDSQVVSLVAIKHFGDPERVWIVGSTRHD